MPTELAVRDESWRGSLPKWVEDWGVCSTAQSLKNVKWSECTGFATNKCIFWNGSYLCIVKMQFYPNSYVSSLYVVKIVVLDQISFTKIGQPPNVVKIDQSNVVVAHLRHKWVIIVLSTMHIIFQSIFQTNFDESWPILEINLIINKLKNNLPMKLHKLRDTF